MRCSVGHPVDEQRALAGVVRAHLGGVDEVLAHLAVEGEEVLDDVAGRVGELLDRAGVALHRAGGELVAAGVGDQPGVGLVADPQAVLGEQRRGVGVVRRDGRLLDLVVGLVVGAGDRAGGRSGSSPACAEAVADPLLELGGGLGGEGQAEDLAGRDLAGGDQPDDAGGHHGGLAGAGAGDHDGRLERGGDRRELLRR